MPGFEGTQDTLIRGRVTPGLWVAWSTPRCWHGETVSIVVRTLYLKDPADLRLTILDPDDTLIDTIDLKVNDPGVTHSYDVKWSDKQEFLRVDVYEFRVKAEIAAHELEAWSEPMAIDLEPPVLSG